MKRAAIVSAGLVLGALFGSALGGCSYFECSTVDLPMESGTYSAVGGATVTVDVATRTATSTYEANGQTVRAEYTMGLDMSQDE